MFAASAQKERYPRASRRSRKGADGVGRLRGVGEKVQFAARFPGMAREHMRRFQRKIISDGGAGLRENVVEHIAHRKNGRPRIDERAARIHLTHFAARPVEFLDDGHIAPLRGELDSRRQPSDPCADDNDAFFAHIKLPKTTLTGPAQDCPF